MSLALRIILWVEIALGIFWTISAAMAHGAGGLAVVGFFLIIFPLFGAFFLFAAWAWWKHPDKRSNAVWIMALPVVFWFAPVMIRSLSGGFMSQQQFSSLILLLLVATIATCWIFPRKAAALVPDFLVRSRLFNWLVLVSMIGGWLFMVVVVLYLANSPKAIASSTDSSMALAYAIVIAATYLVGLGIASFGASTWAWLSLRGGFEATARKLNIAQLVVAAPGVLTGVFVAVWMAGQGHL